ncbi:MAG TPA: D-hexose-6-phosphate mutarotase, partial [Tepidisphaeraceae bacterium]
MSMTNPTNPPAKALITDDVKFETGAGGLTRIAIHTPDADAHVYLRGGHVTHYQPKGQPPVLFMSRASQFTPGKAIRGGVPVIFPWFGPRAGDAAAPMHGFARTVEWTARAVEPAGSAVGVTLALTSSEETRRWFPHDFELLYTICVGPTLELTLEVRNCSNAEFTFEEALHTYLTVGDVRQATIDGLDGRTFIDKTAAMARTRQAGPFRIERETDRVYLDTPDDVHVADPVHRRRLSVAKSGSQSTVVWNPWVDKAKALPD